MSGGEGWRMRVGVRHERASVAAMPPADLGSNFQAFFERSAEFFRNLSEIRWGAFALALLCLLGMQLARAWAWRNVLHAAYPGQRISFTHLSAAYLAGAGINAVIPAHAGDVTKVFLVKRQIPHSSYPAVTSSFLVQTVFDTTVGALVLLYAITQGLLPPLPRIPDLPAFEISFWADHPKLQERVTYTSSCIAADARKLSNDDAKHAKDDYLAVMEAVDRHNVELAINEGRFRSAVHTSQKLVNLHPDSSENVFYLAESYRTLGPRNAELTAQQLTSGAKKKAAKSVIPAKNPNADKTLVMIVTVKS